MGVLIINLTPLRPAKIDKPALCADMLLLSAFTYGGMTRFPPIHPDHAKSVVSALRAGIGLCTARVVPIGRVKGPRESN